MPQISVKGKEKRFRFAKDDDGHTYLIPADKQEQFEEWVDSMEEGTLEGEDFEKYNIGGYFGLYTFTDPQED